METNSVSLQKQKICSAGGQVEARSMPKPDLESAVRVYLEDRCRETLDGVVRAGEGLVSYYAALYSPGRRRDEDLKQAGYEGLLKAIKRYDPARNVLFITYASHCIMGEVRRELKRKSTFKVPEWLSNLQAGIIKATEELVQEKGAMPTLKEIAARVNVAEAGVVQAMQAGSVSLEEIELSRIKSLQYESFKLPIEDIIALQTSLDRLNETQKKVLELIFFQDLTQEQVARKMGLNQRKVSRVLGSGLSAMRLELGDT